MNFDVKINKEENRFETRVGEDLCEINYTITPEGDFRITHTGVPSHLNGQGIASAMTEYMLKYARKNSLKICPLCPYTKAYLQRHPEYQDVVSEKWEGQL